MQIIVSSRLSAKEHHWLMSLTGTMSKDIGKRLVLSANSLSEKDDRENADSVLQLALAKNPDIFKQLKEVPEMCEALNTLMKPELDAARSGGENKGRNDRIMSLFNKGRLVEEYTAEELNMSLDQFREAYKTWMKKENNSTALI